MTNAPPHLSERQKSNIRSMLRTLSKLQASVVKDSVYWDELGKAQAMGIELLLELEGKGPAK